ncbi:hypothetical protein H4Q26_004019 [Puccinia striiformis f. sp. tritici PST-130]|nr:hypothetical protein H4Q26_004019 [Puccinia striiformis f. sp. tritici PST-130]
MASAPHGPMKPGPNLGISRPPKVPVRSAPDSIASPAQPENGLSYFVLGKEEIIAPNRSALNLRRVDSSLPEQFAVGSTLKSKTPLLSLLFDTPLPKANAHRKNIAALSDTYTHPLNLHN